MNLKDLEWTQRRIGFHYNSAWGRGGQRESLFIHNSFTRREEVPSTGQTLLKVFLARQQESGKENCIFVSFQPAESAISTSKEP